MQLPSAASGSSLGEELGHHLLVGEFTGAACGDPLPVLRERRLDLGLVRFVIIRGDVGLRGHVPTLRPPGDTAWVERAGAWIWFQRPVASQGGQVLRRAAVLGTGSQIYVRPAYPGPGAAPDTPVAVVVGRRRATRLGSPRRVRGRPLPARDPRPKARITPTCAGTVACQGTSARSTSDHLRVPGTACALGV
jgi:hypothetical protein